MSVKIEDFQTFGRELFLSGLNDSHSGNMSVRIDNTIYITKTGSMLGLLGDDDIVPTTLYPNGHIEQSRETIGHRAIYEKTGATAIIHAHPPDVIVLSMIEDEIVPVDSEGRLYNPHVPVLKVDNPNDSAEMARKLPGCFKDNKVVVVWRHGSFAIGKTLEEAYLYTSSLNHSSKKIGRAHV